MLTCNIKTLELLYIYVEQEDKSWLFGSLKQEKNEDKKGCLLFCVRDQDSFPGFINVTINSKASVVQ